jgi:hypothetical protein
MLIFEISFMFWRLIFTHLESGYHAIIHLQLKASVIGILATVTDHSGALMTDDSAHTFKPGGSSVIRGQTRTNIGDLKQVNKVGGSFDNVGMAFYALAHSFVMMATMIGDMFGRAVGDRFLISSIYIGGRTSLETMKWCSAHGAHGTIGQAIRVLKHIYMAGLDKKQQMLLCANIHLMTTKCLLPKLSASMVI